MLAQTQSAVASQVRNRKIVSFAEKEEVCYLKIPLKCNQSTI